MKKDTIKKIAAIGGFVFLLTGFVVFKSGGFDTLLEEGNDKVVPLVKADSTLPTIPTDTHQMEASVPVPPLPTDAKGFKRQEVLAPAPPFDAYRDDIPSGQVEEPVHVDTFYLDVISMSSKSAITIDQSKWIWKLDSLIDFDSTEVEE